MAGSGFEIVCENPVYVAVTDMGGHGIPTVLPEGYGGSYSEGGRGLRMLYELALMFGMHGSSTLGHTVWVDIDLNRKLEAESPTPAQLAPVPALITPAILGRFWAHPMITLGSLRLSARFLVVSDWSLWSVRADFPHSGSRCGAGYGMLYFALIEQLVRRET